MVCQGLANTPRIRFRIRQSVRFPGFAKPWKEIRLDSLGSCVRSVSYKPGTVSYKPGTDLWDRAAFRKSNSHRVCAFHREGALSRGPMSHLRHRGQMIVVYLKPLSDWSLVTD